jgi:hypothetical protein
LLLASIRPGYGIVGLETGSHVQKIDRFVSVPIDFQSANELDIIDYH